MRGEVAGDRPALRGRRDHGSVPELRRGVCRDLPSPGGARRLDPPEGRRLSRGLRKLAHSLYAQVLVAVALGALLGVLNPALGAAMKPLGGGFIKLVKMLIAPSVFTTVVTGIAKMGDLKRVGRIGLKGLVYFEVLTTFALALGLLVGKLVQPGSGMNVNAATLDTKALASYTTSGHALSTTDFLLNTIPKDVADAFARGDILQVLLFSILFGVALAGFKEKGSVVLGFIEELSHVLFR